MGRHEIRLRRKMMTSRRIEGHKDYYHVLKQHQKMARLRKLIKLVVLLLFFIGLIFFSYYVLPKLGESKSQQKETSELIISWPGVYTSSIDDDMSTKRG